MATDRRMMGVSIHRGRLVAWLGLLLGGLAAGCGDDDDLRFVAPPALPALARLHATRGATPMVVDAAGRQVLLRGVNVNGLGDYYQGNATYPTVLPLTDDDFREMAQYGFNTIRLVLSWSALEPEPDRISEGYLSRIRAAVDAAKRHGLYVVLDMHQDAWGKYIASPPGTVCAPGREPSIGWDGAPEWATFTDGKGTCRVTGVRELAPAVGAAFNNFYDDRDGIQTHLIRTWAALVRAFASEDAVAGYDLFNEPHFATGLSGTAPRLAAFYTRLVDAIRSAEGTAGGFSHIVFFEPVITWPSPDTAPPNFTDDPNIVFAPHNYAESITGFNMLTIEQGFTRAAADAAQYGTTFWIGEWGWFSDPPQTQEKVVRYAREEDRHHVGGVWWQWKQACGDPHSIGTPGGEPPPELLHFHRSTCPGDAQRGVVDEWAVILSRPYPRAAPGQLVTLESDGLAGKLHLTGNTTATGADLDLWVPDRGRGTPRITGTGIGPPRIVDVPGGYRVFAPVSGNYAVAVD